jgi:Zn-dependent protease
MGGSVTLFRVRGIPVKIHASWLVIVGLLTWTLSVGYFPQVLPDLPATSYWIQGFLAALLLFVSVLLHELAHAIAARGYGIPVSGITLHVFGGVSQLEREPPRPGVEVVVAIVGPLTSFALAALLGLAGALVPLQPGALAIVRYLTLVNLVVGVFNLLPGFPLDGGRLLRAVLWKAKGNLGWATRTASRVGSGFALLLVALGAVRALGGEFLGGLWLVLIGLFLRQAAEGSYQQHLLRRVLGPLTVRDVMAREVIRISPDLSLAQVIDQFFWPHHVSSFPVVEGERVVGVLGLAQLRTTPPDLRVETAVREVMLPVAEPLVAAPGDGLEDALKKLSGNGLGRLAVVENGRLVGYLSLKDVLHVVAVSPDR